MLSWAGEVGTKPFELLLHDYFYQQHVIDINTIVDLNNREEKIQECVEDYLSKQNRAIRIVRNNLYDLIHNVDKIYSRIMGKPLPKDDVSYDEKISSLARIQCEAYFDTGVLK